MKESSLFIRFVGGTPLARMLDFLIENKGLDFSKKAIAEGADISKTTLFEHWPILNKFAVVKVTRQFGKTRLYTLNAESEVVQKLLALEYSLIEQAMTQEVTEKAVVKPISS